MRSLYSRIDLLRVANVENAKIHVQIMRLMCCLNTSKPKLGPGLFDMTLQGNVLQPWLIILLMFYRKNVACVFEVVATSRRLKV